MHDKVFAACILMCVYVKTGPKFKPLVQLDTSIWVFKEVFAPLR